MDLWHEFLLGVLIAIVAWILTLVFHENFVALFSSIGVAFVFIPIIFIVSMGFFNMQSVSNNLTAMNKIAGDTTNNLITYFVNNFPHLLVDDLAGTIVGVVFGFFVSMFHK